MKQVQSVQFHLSILRKRKKCILRHSRADTAQLLRNHQLQKALDRVKQLYKDQCLLAAYDLIGDYCQCIATNMPLIRSHPTSLECLPGDVIEAMSSLVFAASRCGELRELNAMRNLVRRQFGYKFEVANVELHKGNLVNSNMKQNLCKSSVPDEEKLKLIKEIAEEHNLQLGFQDFGTIPGHSQTESNTRNHKKNAVQMDQQESLKISIKKSDLLKKKNCCSLDSTMDKLKERKGKLSGHVHPKLPDYEEIVAELTNLKVKHKPQQQRQRQRKRFSFFLSS